MCENMRNKNTSTIFVVYFQNIAKFHIAHPGSFCKLWVGCALLLLLHSLPRAAQCPILPQLRMGVLREGRAAAVPRTCMQLLEVSGGQL